MHNQDRRPHPGWRGGAFATVVAALAFSPNLARATSLIVPDQSPTIQAAIDASVDTVLVRPGAYPETLQVGRGIAILGVSESDRPAIARLSIYDDSGLGPTMRYERLQVTGPVTVFAYPSSIALRFIQCDLAGGITDTRTLGSISAILLSKCHLVGTLNLPMAVSVSVDSCDVVGNILATAEERQMEVRNSTFQGGGIHSFGWYSTCTVVGNTIRGGGFGVNIAGAHDVVVTNNLIEDCASDALDAGEYGLITVTNNVIRRCGAGIVARGEETLVADNVIEDCPYGSLFAEFNSVTVRNNVIRRGGRGIQANGDQAMILGNTVMQAGSEGLRVTVVNRLVAIGNVFWMCLADGMRVAYTRESVIVRQNTSCYNGLSGFAADSSTAVQEWTGNIGYANQEYGMSWRRADHATIAYNDWFANRKGPIKGRAPSSGDLFLDPQLCDAPAADLRLNSASPLIDWPGYGQIGALGAGCEATVSADDAAPPPRGFAFAHVGPVPARGRVALEITLPHAAVIEVTVHDVQGRTIARLASGEWSAGRHALEWSGAGSRVAPGLYFIRYRYPGGQAARAIVIAR